MSDRPTVYEAVSAVMAEMPAIGKNQRNTEQGFNFRGIDDVLNAASPLFAKHGVIIVPDVTERDYAQRTTRGGSIMHVVNLHVTFRIYGPAGDFIEGSSWGEGTDMGDKATNKAMTGAFKYMLFQLLAIADGTHDSDRGAPDDTVDWYVANGWAEGKADHDKERQALRDLLATLEPTAQAEFKAWRAEKGYTVTGQSSTAAEVREMAEKAVALSSGGVGAGKDSDPAKDAPQSPDGQDGTDAPPTASNGTGAHTAPDKPDLAVWRAEVNALGPDDLMIALEDRGLDMGGTDKQRRDRLVKAGPVEKASA